MMNLKITQNLFHLQSHIINGIITKQRDVEVKHMAYSQLLWNHKEEKRHLTAIWLMSNFRKSISKQSTMKFQALSSVVQFSRIKQNNYSIAAEIQVDTKTFTKDLLNQNRERNVANNQIASDENSRRWNQEEEKKHFAAI